MISFQAHLIKFWYEKCLHAVISLHVFHGEEGGGHYLRFLSFQVMSSLSVPSPSFQGPRVSVPSSAQSNRCTFKKQTLHAFSALGLGYFSVTFVFLKWEHQGGKRRKKSTNSQL